MSTVSSADKKQDKCVLVVDDESLICMRVKAALESGGYRVYLAENGPDAVALVSSHADIDLVLMDIQLDDGMNGGEAARQILAMRELPIVFLSSYADPHMLECVQGVPAYGHIQKNTADTVVVASVGSALEVHTSRQRQREEQGRLQRVLSSLSSLFIHLPTSQGSSAIDEALAIVGSFIGSDRAYCFEYDFVAGSTSNTHEWCAPGIRPQKENLQNIRLEEIPDWVDAHRHGREIWIGDVAKLPQGRVRSLLEAQGIVSVLTVPLFAHEQCYGFVGIDWTQLHPSCSDEQRILLTALAQMLSSFHLRQAVVKAQSAAHQQVLSVVEGIPAVVYVADMQSHEVLYVNGHCREAFGDIEGHICWKALQNGQASPCKVCSNFRLVNAQGQPTGVHRYKMQNSQNDRWYDCMDRAIEWSDGRVVRMEVAVDITDSVKASEELLKSQQEIGELLQEKELVLKEAHHRIKNNMAMVQGMLSLQADSSKEPGAASLLEDAAGRMQSMMLLYDKLYRAEHHGELALDAFLAPLIEQGIQNYPLKVQVDAQVDIASDVVEAKVLSSLGILVNELVTNSLKHAFTGHAHGRIEVTCARDSDVLNLHYRDNGTGIPEGVLHNGSDHFGLQLLHLLAEQLGGSLEYAADEGACYHLTVPL